MKGYRLKLTIVFMIAIASLLININISTALCCGDACYEYGKCVNGVWYEGCKDGDGNVYGPSEEIGCMKCGCARNDDCSWQPNHLGCKSKSGEDYMCDYNQNELPKVENNIPNSRCTDKDADTRLCTAQVCDDRAGYWITHGEPLKEREQEKWEYLPIDYNTQTKGCCQDDSDEYYTTNIVGASGQKSACCSTPNMCVDKDGLCQNEKSGEVSCDDGFDNDCNGLADQQDPGCCPNADYNSGCCTSAGGVFSQAAGCCGDKPEDNGFVNDRYMCYVKGSTKTWLDLYDMNSAGNIFTISHPEYNTFDILKSNSNYFACDAKDNGFTEGSTQIYNLVAAESKKQSNTNVHKYLCYQSTDSKEQFAECIGHDNAYSSQTTGGTRHTEGQSIQDKESKKRYCCTGTNNLGWTENLDAAACTQRDDGKNTACKIAEYKTTKSGEKQDSNTQDLGNQGDTVCCGDDSYDNYKESIIANTKYTACCDKATDCVDTIGICRNETASGEKTCDDGIDNDCDGLIDSRDPDCCGDGDKDQNCCELHNGIWSNGFCCGDDKPEYAIDASETYPSSFPPNKKGEACCPSTKDCAYDNKCHISAGDGGKENDGNGCYDGFDNDCDGKFDFSEKYIDGIWETEGTAISAADKFRDSEKDSDDDCTVTVEGSIVAEGGEPLSIADFAVRMVGTFNSQYKGKQPKLEYEVTTDGYGKFVINNVNGDSTYDLTVTDPNEDYEPKTVPVKIIGFEDKKDIIVKIGIEHDTCNSDCTSIGNNICNRECDAELGSEAHERCFFGGEESNIEIRKKVRDLCHDQAAGTVIDYPIQTDKDGNPYKIRCCESAPQEYSPTTVTIAAPYGIDLIKTTTVVNVDNRPVNMIINVFR